MQAHQAATFAIQAMLLFAMLVLPPGTHANQTASENSATAQCTQQRLENLRQQALAAYQNQGKTEQAAQAAMELLQDAIDADCLNRPENPSSENLTPQPTWQPPPPMPGYLMTACSTCCMPRRKTYMTTYTTTATPA